MKKSRRPKLTKLNFFKDNSGCRKLSGKKPKTSKDREVKPPSYLDEYALKEWNRVAAGLEKMGALCSVNSQLLDAYCCSYSFWRKTTEQIKNTNFDMKSYPNPTQLFLIGIANMSESLMYCYADEFGLTPSARARLDLIDRSQDNYKWEELLAEDSN